MHCCQSDLTIASNAARSKHLQCGAGGARSGGSLQPYSCSAIDDAHTDDPPVPVQQVSVQQVIPQGPENVQPPQSLSPSK